MKLRFAGAALALLATAVLPAMPAHASTVTVTYNYVYFAYGPHTRQPRTIGANGGFTSIATQSGGQQSTGNTFQPGQLPGTEMVGNATFNFAFVNISGGSAVANGPPVGVSSTNANQPPSVVVGTQNITVLAVYVPVGGPGGPNGGSGATIDSFDETTGSLFNDTFVSVLPDAGGVTTGANVNGFVDTTNVGETITALSPTQPTGVNFSKWVQLASQTAMVNGQAMSVGKGVSTIALAFYDAPPPKVISQCQQELDGLNQIAMDRGPLLLTVQYNKIKADLQKCVMQHQLTQAEVNAAENAYQAMLNNRNHPPPLPHIPH